MPYYCDHANSIRESTNHDTVSGAIRMFWTQPANCLFKLLVNISPLPFGTQSVHAISYILAFNASRIFGAVTFRSSNLYLADKPPAGANQETTRLEVRAKSGEISAI
jgi:hypothetical protein